MKDKGFTLIELLAVIVILAIIALIAAPVVLNIISDSKKSANERSIELYEKAINNSIAASMMNNPNSIIPNGEYTITTNGLCKSGDVDTPGGVLICKKTPIKILVENSDKLSGKVWVKNGTVVDYDITLEGENFLKCFEFDSNTKTITGYSDDCSKDVIIPSKINSVDVLKIDGEAFASKGLTSVVIPEGIVEIGEAAFHDNKLTTVTIPPTVTTIGSNAFYMNPNLTQAIIIGKTAGQLNISTVFQIHTNVVWGTITDTTCFVFNSNTKTITGYSDDCSKDVIIPSKINSVDVLKIDGGAFASKELTSVSLQEGIAEIGGGAFLDNNLTSVTIPSTVTTIGGQAFFMNSLERVVILGKTSGQLDVDGVFQWVSGKSNDDIEWNG